ncbi:MAG TPA: hypothetical protein PKX87_03560, partial [Alphaproteobacteria bacterium]|nr:hypothetical protein [Alphaproteobacteria bacterium]
MLTTRLPAFFMIAFLVIGFVFGVSATRQTVEKTPVSNYENIVKGHWTLAFDRKFAEALAFYAPSRDFWGIVDYVLFREGRKGVVVGQKGWLFTDEEFSVWPHMQGNIQARLERIEKVRDLLKEKNVALVVALLPAKTRLYSGYTGDLRWPAGHEHIYESVLGALREKAIPVADLY